MVQTLVILVFTSAYTLSDHKWGWGGVRQEYTKAVKFWLDQANTQMAVACCAITGTQNKCTSNCRYHQPFLCALYARLFQWKHGNVKTSKAARICWPTYFANSQLQFMGSMRSVLCPLQENELSWKKLIKCNRSKHISAHRLRFTSSTARGT